MMKNKLKIQPLIKSPNSVGGFLKQWNIKCQDKNKKGKLPNFVEPAKSSCVSGISGSKSLPPISDSFMYFESAAVNSGNPNDFV